MSAARASSTVAARGSLALVAYVYLRRYRAGSGFAVASLVYLVLQLPAYSIIFGKNIGESNWPMWLAFAKLVSAMTFYASFFSVVPDAAPIQVSVLAQLPTVRPRLRKAVVYVGLALGSGLLTAVGDVVGKMLLKRFGQ